MKKLPQEGSFFYFFVKVIICNGNDPHIETVCFRCGKEKVISEIREGVKKAVTGQKKECQVALPEHFTYEVTYKDWKKAYTMSFYPGMQKVDTFTNKLETDRWMDIVTAHCFVVY